MQWTKRIVNMLKFSISALVTIILVYPLIGIVAFILKALQTYFNCEGFFELDNLLVVPPMLLPVNFDSVTIDILPLFAIVIAGIYGWVKTPLDNHK